MPTSGRTAADGDAPPSRADEALIALFIGAASSASELAGACGLSAEEASRLVEACARAGLVEHRSDDRLVVSADGCVRVQRLLAGERAALGADVRAIAPAFASL